MDALKDEINRIADSANFNGIKLLDGSMGSSVKAAASITTDTDTAGTPATLAAATVNVAATAGSTWPSSFTAGDEVEIKDANNTFTATYGSSGWTVVSSNAKYSATFDGSTLTVKAKTTAAGAMTGNDILDGTAGNWTVTFDDTAGTNAGATVNMEATAATFTNGAASVAATNNPTATADFTGKTGSSINGAKIVYSGTTYVFTTDAAAVTSGTAVTVAAGDTAGQIASKFQAKAGAGTVSGSKVTFVSATTTAVALTKAAASSTGGGLTLQIGDTSDSWNQMSVKINDMHTGNLGIDGISIKDQTSAASAISVIKAAINTVSSTRGDLGAIQNRLEHTSNNLSVMTENIQDAESTIRDTDIADEMTAYTKNQILVQSAQAMLAQANSVPQGVLQLLQ
jgi:flagellin